MVRILTSALLALVVLPAQAAIILTDFQGLLRTTTNDRGTTVELLADADGGIATGILEYPPDPISPGGRNYPPDPVRWAMGIEPTPFQPVLTFIFDDTGNYLGVEPTPFRVISMTTGKLYGELRFEDVSEVGLGSLLGITGATLTTPGGEVLAVDPFNIVAVSAPPVSLLLAGMLVAILRRHHRGPAPA